MSCIPRYRIASAGSPHVPGGVPWGEKWVVLDQSTGEVMYGPGPEEEAIRVLGKAVARDLVEKRRKDREARNMIQPRRKEQ